MSRGSGADNSHVTYAGFWLRVLATIVDSLLITCLLWPLLFLVPGAVVLDIPVAYGDIALWSQAVVAAVPGPVNFLFTWVLPAIAVIVFWILRSATPGKMLISAKIVDARTGDYPGKARLIGRYFGYFLSTIPLGLGLLWVAFDPRKQGWHDKLAGTVVVRRQRSATPDFAESAQIR